MGAIGEERRRWLDGPRWPWLCKIVGHQRRAWFWYSYCGMTPDFYLPSVRMWAEVKGAYFGLDEEKRCEQVCRGTRRNFLYLDGSPNFRQYYGATIDAGDVTVVPYSLDIHWFDKAYRERRLFAQPEYDGPDPTQFSKKYQIAIYEARRDRFGAKDA